MSTARASDETMPLPRISPEAADGREGLALAGNAQAADRIAAGGRHGLSDHVATIAAHPGRIDLGPTGLGRQQRILAIGRGPQAAFRVEHGRLAAGGADVQSEVAHGRPLWFVSIVY